MHITWNKYMAGWMCSIVCLDTVFGCRRLFKNIVWKLMNIGDTCTSSSLPNRNYTHTRPDYSSHETSDLSSSLLLLFIGEITAAWNEKLIFTFINYQYLSYTEKKRRTNVCDKQVTGTHHTNTHMHSLFVSNYCMYSTSVISWLSCDKKIEEISLKRTSFSCDWCTDKQFSFGSRWLVPTKLSIRNCRHNFNSIIGRIKIGSVVCYSYMLWMCLVRRHCFDGVECEQLL